VKQILLRQPANEDFLPLIELTGEKLFNLSQKVKSMEGKEGKTYCFLFLILLKVLTQ